MDLIFEIFFLHYFARIKMLVIRTFFNTKDLYSKCAVHTQSNW